MAVDWLAKKLAKGAFDRAPELFEEGAKLFEEGARLFEEGAKLFEEGAKLFEEGAKLFEKGTVGRSAKMLGAEADCAIEWNVCSWSSFFGLMSENVFPASFRVGRVA